MLLQKWNPTKHIYEPFESPANNVLLFTKDMTKIVDCANCGCPLCFGESYTSRLIHTDMGFGYPVCSDCYHEETLALK